MTTYYYVVTSNSRANMIPSASGSSATGSAQLTVDRLDHCAIQTLKKVLLLAEKSEGCLNDSEVWTMSPEG